LIWFGLVLVIALHPQTPKHIRGAWSHYDYTDTSEPVDGNGAENMVTVQCGFRTRDLSITGPTCLPTALTGPTTLVGTISIQSVYVNNEEKKIPPLVPNKQFTCFGKVQRTSIDHIIRYSLFH
jgi:hypothetical protein